MRSGLFGIAMAVACAQGAYAQERQSKAAASQYDGIIAKHAAATGVPEALIRRVIVRESRYNPRALSRGNYGMMQIKPATARSMGYQGGPAGLLDADTNLTYAVRYLAGAYRVAGGNHDRAVRLYASGYYYDAKRRGMLAAVGLGRGAKPFATAVLAAAPAAAQVASLAPSVPQQAPAEKRVISPSVAPALATTIPAARPAIPVPATTASSRVATAAAAVGGLERVAAASPATPDSQAAAYDGERRSDVAAFSGVKPPLPRVARPTVAATTPVETAVRPVFPNAPTVPALTAVSNGSAVPIPPMRDPEQVTATVEPRPGSPWPVRRRR